VFRIPGVERIGILSPEENTANPDCSLLRHVEPLRRKRRQSLSQSSLAPKAFDASTPTTRMTMTKMISDAVVVMDPPLDQHARQPDATLPERK
jgi:hypothetical protein